MNPFQEVRTFCAVAEAGSFVRAAEALDFSKAAVSRYVGGLESRLGVRLLHRTTRRLSLTDEGETFYARSKELLAGLEEAESELRSRSSSARGVLRINAPVTFGILHLAPLWGAFCERHPQVRLDLTLSDRTVDLVEEGYDVAIRIAALPDSTLISKRLAGTRIVLCASPRYLEASGVPSHPSELARHSVIAYRYYSTGDEWQFDGPGGDVSVRTKPIMHSNSGDACRAMALGHQGVILQPDFLVGPDLADGTLVELMPEFHAQELGIYAVYPTRKHVSPKVRALIEYLVGRFTGVRW